VKFLNQKEREQIQKLNEKIRGYDEIVMERVAKDDSQIPLIVVLENRKNHLLKSLIVLESEIRDIKMNKELYSDEMLFVKQTRLDRIKGRIEEVDNTIRFILKTLELGRGFSFEQI